MNTNQLKISATKAREILRRGVLNKLHWLGFDDEGRPIEKERPQVYQGGTAWRNAVYPESFGQQWLALAAHIERRGLREVVEEGAYTWFNRLMAIHILAKNNLCEPILDYSETGLPMLVEDARIGRIPEMSAQRRAQFEELIADSSQLNAQFALLISEWCRQNPIVNACFGSIDDYMELLLPLDITAPSGFINLLNTTVNLTEEDYHSSELIGWLYQFYISDRKDEVFAKKGKVEADEIPAATQIFTPNWIVKYMLQNSVLPQLGITEGEYLVHNDDAPVLDRFTSTQLESFKIADLACGSGHILVEAFDLLYNLYIEEGYMPDEAIGHIFRNNLLGIDIDLRAQQLAKFALMLKAAQRDESLALEPIMPRVLTIPEFVDILSTSKYQDENFSYHRAVIHSFFRNSVSADVAKEIEGTFELLKDAHSLGSIMKFNISPSTRRALAETVKYWSSKDASDRPEFVNDFLPAADLILALTDSSDAIVMNPPYMGANKMDNVLSNYVNDIYPDSRADLMTVFMEAAIYKTKVKGYWAMINLPSWMFLNSFENFRYRIIKDTQIICLNHNGRGVFGSDFGSVCFVCQNVAPYKKGHYRKLYEEHVHVRKNETIEQLYLDSSYGCYIADQLNFLKIPKTPIAYWINENYFTPIDQCPKLGEIAQPRAGLQTSDNNRFLRYWHEVSFDKIGLNLEREVALKSVFKWFPHNKGGAAREWYGNRDLIINFENDGKELKYWLEHNPKDPTTTSWSRNLRNYPLYFHKALTWSAVGSGRLTVRYSPTGSLFDTSGPILLAESQNELMYILGLTNTVVFDKYLSIFAQGISKGSGHFSNVPYIHDKSRSDEIVNIVEACISISKSDWDAHETSWDFQKNELVAINEENWMDILNEYCEYSGICVDPEPPRPNSLEWLLDMYKMKWNTRFLRLRDNEEELNRRFIEIYGLEDELTPDVPMDEVTILQQGEISISKSKEVIDGKEVEGDLLHWNHDVIIKQLISYIVGCWMGRYRLDRPGLNIAHLDATEDELEPYIYGPDAEEFEIDDDAIIPVLPKDSPFEDNLTSRIEDFVRIVWGEETMADNLNFIEHCLGKSIDDYVNKDFWKDHKKMYQNRPIYWLFSSKKGAFKCLVYAHRMTKHTVSLIRSKYLLRYINWMEEKVTAMSANADKLSTRQQKDLEKTRQAIAECNEYHNRLQQVAERAIEFDLDDGIPHNHSLFGDIVVKLK